MGKMNKRQTKRDALEKVWKYCDETLRMVGREIKKMDAAEKSRKLKRRMKRSAKESRRRRREVSVASSSGRSEVSRSRSSGRRSVRSSSSSGRSDVSSSSSASSEESLFISIGRRPKARVPSAAARELEEELKRRFQIDECFVPCLRDKKELEAMRDRIRARAKARAKPATPSISSDSDLESLFIPIQMPMTPKKPSVVRDENGSNALVNGWLEQNFAQDIIQEAATDPNFLPDVGLLDHENLEAVVDGVAEQSEDEDVLVINAADDDVNMN